MISILCANKDSNYKLIPGLDVWDMDRDAYFFTGSNPVITHAPCAQWSRMRKFANDIPDEKELAFHCLKYVVRNGGIFEHPAQSSFFKEAGINMNHVYSFDQVWFGFPARKTTWLFFSQCKPIQFPIMSNIPTTVVCTSRKRNRKEMPKSQRSTTVIPFAQWLVDCINEHIEH